MTIEAYANDAVTWVKRASELSPCVWIAGHSEGGLVALVAAENHPQNLCGLILLATPGRPVGRLLIEQVHANPANASVVSDVEMIVKELEAGRKSDPKSLPAALQPLFSEGLQRYMIDLFLTIPRRSLPIGPDLSSLCKGLLIFRSNPGTLTFSLPPCRRAYGKI
ncbi:alpha/beta hydrolase [Ochrobactrum ciceri]|uniref:Alpha/beta hydrolase n=1 Tax=Brucella ciceri TaxID=391287 RepID=A0ABX1DS78_9HYPH|nr:alpha/beta hydrolase [Brucella ciceri]